MDRSIGGAAHRRGASILFLTLPRWRTRSGRVAVLSEHDTVIRDQIHDLSERAGLRKPPKIVIDLVATRIGAVAFGSNRNPVIRINGAAIKERQSRPKVFEAVLLHEFAHIRNRDITLTYVSVALWRAFVALAVIPYLIIEAISLPNAANGIAPDTEVPIIVASLGLAIILVCLTYLARLEVLRRREFDADQAAIEWKADPHVLEKLADETSGHWLIRRLSPLWQTHPGPQSRKAALDDPSALFRIRPLMLVLTGAAAILITDQVPVAALRFVGVPSDWVVLGMVTPAAALVTIVVGGSLWNAVIHAALRGGTAPTGVIEGLWLGTGMVLGQFASINGDYRVGWLPDYPLAYLLLVPVAVAFTCWVSQTARIWTEQWPGKRIAPIMLANLAGSAVLLGVALAWWTESGIGFSSKVLLDDVALIQRVTEGLFASSADRYEQVLALVFSSFPFWVGVLVVPLTWAALAVLLLPLLVWSVPNHMDGRPWATQFNRARPTPPIELMPLRRLVWAVMLGTLVAFAGILTVKALMDPWADELGGNVGEGGSLDLMVYSFGTEAAVMAGALTAAISASAVAGRYRLLAAVISAQLAVWTSLAVAFVVTTTDGCHGSLDVFRATCGLNPGAAVLLTKVDVLICLVIGSILAFVGAALVCGIQGVLRIRSRWGNRTLPVSRAATDRRARRWAVLAICAPLAGFAISAEVAASSETGSGNSSAELAELIVADDAVVSPEMRTLQVGAWLDYGGSDLIDRLFLELIDFTEFWIAVDGTEANPEGYIDIDEDELEAICVEIRDEARDAQRYFTIPDAEAQELWEEAVSILGRGARACLTALDEGDQYGLLDSAVLISSAAPYLESAVERLDEIPRHSS